MLTAALSRQHFVNVFWPDRHGQFDQNGRNTETPDIKIEDVQWAREVLDWSLGQTALMIKEHASNSYIEGKIKKVLKIIKQIIKRIFSISSVTK